MLEKYVIQDSSKVSSTLLHLKYHIVASYFDRNYRTANVELGVECKTFQKETTDGRTTVRGLFSVDVLSRWKIPITLIYSSLVESTVGKIILEESDRLDSVRIIKNEVVEEVNEFGNVMLGVIIKDRTSRRWHKPGMISSVIHLDRNFQTNLVSVKLFDALKLLRYYGSYDNSNVRITKETNMLK